MSGVAENKRMRRRILKILKPLHACAVENTACPGYPDISFVGGWFEMKELERWPKNQNDTVKIPHFTQDQRLWLLMCNRAGGFADVLLKVKNDWFWIYGPEAAKHLGRTWTKDELEMGCWKSWIGGLKEDQFLDAVRACKRQQ